MKLLDEGVLQGLLGNAAARLAFPFLALPKSKPACCGRRTQHVQPDYNTMKQAIAQLPPEQLKQLLGMAKLTQARMIYTQNGRILDVKLG